MRILSYTICAFALLATLPACSRLSTPSMMNTTLPRVAEQTTIEERALGQVSDGYLQKVAADHDRFGTGPVHLSLSYDPASRNYDAMNAFDDVSSIKARLRKAGVQDVRAETIKGDGAPMLMVSYDSASALPPEGCQNMPGLDHSVTTAEIGSYKFGCSVDTMLARQIYRPTDLKGVGSADPIDGRRATNSAEYYRRVGEEDATGDLNRIQRSDIQAQ